MEKEKERVPAKTFKRGELTDIVRGLWADHTCTEIAAMTGACASSVSDIALAHGWRHSPETTERIHRARVASGRRLFEMGHEKSSERIRRMRKMERFRLLSGLPPRTRWAVKGISKRQAGVKNKLKTLYGYHYSAGDLLTLLYDDDTRRRLTGHYDEDYYTRRYGLEFIKAED